MSVHDALWSQVRGRLHIGLLAVALAIAFQFRWSDASPSGFLYLAPIIALSIVYVWRAARYCLASLATRRGQDRRSTGRAERRAGHG